MQELEQALQGRSESFSKLQDALQHSCALEEQLQNLTQQLTQALEHGEQKELTEQLLVGSLVDLDAEKRRLQKVLEAVWNDLRNESVQRALLEERLRWAAEEGLVGASWGKVGGISGDHVVVCPALQEPGARTFIGSMGKRGSSSSDAHACRHSVHHAYADRRRDKRKSGSGDAVVVCMGSLHDAPPSGKKWPSTELTQQQS
jgi:hypothetical protein